MNASPFQRVKEVYCKCRLEALVVLVVLVVAMVIGSHDVLPAPVGTSYWRIPDGYSLYGSSGPGMRSAVFLIYLGVTTALGIVLLTTMLSVRPEQREYVLRWLPLAGFLPGYFLVIGINRSLTMLMPNTVALLVLPAVFVATLLLLNPGRGALVVSMRPILTGVAQCAVVFVLSLILQVQVDNSGYILGDGTRIFLDFIQRGVGLAPDEYFPIFVQHYDEVMFLFPFLVPQQSGEGVIELFWLLYAFGVIGRIGDIKVPRV